MRVQRVLVKPSEYAIRDSLHVHPQMLPLCSRSGQHALS